MKYLNQTKVMLSFATALLFTHIITTNASAETVYIKSLDKEGESRGLCLQKSSRNLRLKKCDKGNNQKFEIVRKEAGRIQIKYKDSCVVTKFSKNLQETRDNIKGTVKIRLSDCSPSKKDTLINAKFNLWTLDGGLRLRSFNFLSNLNICMSDEDKGDKIRANDCNQAKNPGRWKFSPA